MLVCYAAAVAKKSSTLSTTATQNKLLSSLILLVFFYPLASEGGGDVLVCNGVSAIGNAFTASVYSKYPVMHTDECDHPSDYEEIFVAELFACFFAPPCMGPFIKMRYDRLARCENLAKRLADQEANLNAVIPESEVPFSTGSSLDSTEIYTDYSVEIDPNAAGTNFGVRTSHTVIWFVLLF